ncbi:MAG: hypothetical protein M5U22_04845 [Thermoleophilia bacterium]|nr:hypothetical protein [Thermoleophilia bacterium]
MEDPAADLPLALAVASSFRDQPLGEVAAFGELSLTGQVRYVAHGEIRLQELARRGFRHVLAPARNVHELRARGPIPPGVALEAVTDMRELLRGLIG